MRRGFLDNPFASRISGLEFRGGREWTAISDTLGARLRALRIERGLSQPDLGRRFNVAKQTISNYETGATSPTPDQVRAFADFFGVSTDYLLGRASDRGPITDPPPGRLAEETIFYRATQDLTPVQREKLLGFIDAMKDEHKRKGLRPARNRGEQ